jgi:hypothetical protein
LERPAVETGRFSHVCMIARTRAGSCACGQAGALTNYLMRM